MYIARYKTSDKIDDILLTSDGKYLTGLYFEDSFGSRKHTGNYIEQELPIFEETKKWLDIYFSGKEPDFTLEVEGHNLEKYKLPKEKKYE